MHKINQSAKKAQKSLQAEFAIPMNRQHPYDANVQAMLDLATALSSKIQQVSLTFFCR